MVFSDEKRFCVWNDGPVRVWRRREQRFEQGFTRGTVKNKKGVMAWLAIKSNGEAKLVRCDDRQDSASYQSRILTPNLAFIRGPRPSLRNPTVVFQHDGASCHTSHSTVHFLREQRVSVLTPWPAMSPDMNIVEHCWAYLAKQLVGMSFSTADSLWEAIESAWAARPAELIPHLYGSMARRLTAVVVAKGGSTRY